MMVKSTKKDFIDVNQFVTLKKEEFSEFSLIEEFESKIFTQMDDQILDFVHKENNFVDFDRDRLLFHMSSSEGSCICEGDINGDGYKDLYIGGSKVIQVQSIFGTIINLKSIIIH